MRRLALDFRRRPRASLAGWMLLGCCALSAAAVLWAEREIAAETALHSAALARIERALPDEARASVVLAAKERDLPLADMQRVRARLNLPWGELFATLESLVNGDVALLSLTPDARKRQVRIAGEARDFAAMLAFHRRLEDSAPLRDVSLLNHEFVEQAPGRPVRFSLVAAWAIDDARP